jgi:pyrophosphatase PpaX
MVHRYVDGMLRASTILFDLDGTLIDSIELIIDSYLHVVQVHGLPLLTRTEIIEGIGTPLVSVFGRMTDDRDTIAAWIATYREYNLSHHDTRVQAFPGIVEVVQQIRGAGRRTGIVTSKNHHGARRGLSLIGLQDAMDVVIGADDVTHHKPHPEPVHRALEQLGVLPADAVFIGDSHHDIASGRAAGVHTIAVTWGPISRERLALELPDQVVDTPAELLRALGLAPQSLAG